MISADETRGDARHDPGHSLASAAAPVGAAAQTSAPVPALRRGLAVLRLLASRPVPLSAATVARSLELPRSTTYELLTELAAAGFAVHLPAERRWGLGVAAFEIGSAYLRAEPLERLGRPTLVQLARSTGGTAHLGILQGPETLYLAKEKPAGAAPTLVTDVGVRLPAALTATGLSVLAHLPRAQARALFPDRPSFQIRTGRGPSSLAELRSILLAVQRRGWAQEDGQVTVGTASVASPILDHNGMPVAALGVTVRHVCPAPPDAAGCGQDFSTLAGPVVEAAAALSKLLGGS